MIFGKAFIKIIHLKKLKMKYLYIVVLCIFFSSCSNDSDNENLQAINGNEKLQKLTIIDEDLENGVYSFHEKLDLTFGYNQNKLVTVIDSGGKYNETLSYVNGNLKNITITGIDFPGLDNNFPLNIVRDLFYDSSNRLIKAVNPTIDIYGQTQEKHYEYPSNNLIIVKDFLITSSGNQILQQQTKIYFTNQNVEKIELFNNTSATPYRNMKFEYDSKINPNTRVDFNRILALPEKSYTVNIIQNYSQLSKNNVLKIINNDIYGATEYQTFLNEINYIYDSATNLPITQSFKILDVSNNIGYKITGSYSF